MEVPAFSTIRVWFGRTPLTDPRSLGSSLLFHVLLLVIASAAALSVATRDDPEPSRAIVGEFDPVDNRARGSDGPGGGSSGEINGDRLAVALETITAARDAAARKAPADALLAEILPAPVASESIQQALPGPQITGLGLVPGAGSGGGGGGGSGGGAGGGVGHSIGPGTEFFGAKENARSFAYVIDCSGSMAVNNSLGVAKRELINSLSQLPPDVQFAVIFYNLSASVFADPRGRRGMMAATPENKGRISADLASVLPDGGTDHMVALRAALALRPEVIYFLTDADLMTRPDAAAIIAEAGRCRIQAIEFGTGVELTGSSNPLRKLAAATGGTYRYINVSSFPKIR